MRLNLPHSNHRGPDPVVTPEGVYTWEPFSTQHQMLTVVLAVKKIVERLLSDRFVLAACEVTFKALPLRKTLTDVWNDPDVWFSFNSLNHPFAFGTTLQGTKEISIGNFPFIFPDAPGVVAATMIHEMAHVAGAPRDTDEAERTLLKCGFGDYFSPEIIGMVRRGSRRLFA